MFSLPVVLIRPGKTPEFHNGTLHRLPPENTGKQRTAEYSRQAIDGWSTDPHGNDQYRVSSIRGDIYIFVGLRIFGKNRKAGRLNKVISGFTKNQIEEYAKGVVDREDELHKEINKTIDSLVHDMTQLSSAIHFQAQNALSFINNPSKVRGYLKSILASQTMLKLRTTVLDYSGDVIEGDVQDEISAYKKLDKVRKCFEPIANDRGIIIDLLGNSLSSCFGPDVLEVVFYILLDNAVKYSPSDSKVTISISESDGLIIIFIGSIGPEINESEEEKIFEKGYRSKNAMDSGVKGTGLGLHLAKSLLSLFRGKISLKSSSNDSEKTPDGLASVLVSVELPISKKDYYAEMVEDQKKRKRSNKPRSRKRRQRRKHT